MANKNTFIKDFSNFFSGAIIAQLIAFIVGPVLSRLYEPSDFGLFAIYIQIVAPLLVLGGAGLFLLLPIHKDMFTSGTVFKVTLCLSVCTSVVVIILGTSKFIENKYFNLLWPYLAIGILLNNLRGFFHFQSVADKFFLGNSKSKLIESTGASSFNVFGGYIGFTQFGLIIGNILGQILFLFSFLSTYKKKIARFFQKQSQKSIIEFMRINKKHILLQSVNQLIEYLLVLLFSIMITQISSIGLLGSFVFCYKVIYTPLSLFAEYFGQASLSRISDLSSCSGKRLFLLKSFVLLFLICLGLILLFKTFGGQIFVFVFGDSWEQAGKISEVYILGIASTFFIKSLQYIPNAINRHEIYTFVSIVTFGLPVGAVAYASLHEADVILSLETLSYALAIHAIFYAMMLLKIFSNKD